jgi:hypothetical protein
MYLGNNSAAKVLAELEPTLSELHLDDNFVSLLSYSEYSNQIIDSNRDYLRNWGTRVLILILLMVMLIIQSALINYERESRRIAVFKIQGYKFLDRYIKPIGRFTLTWLIIIAAIVGIYFSPAIDSGLGQSRFMERLMMTIAQYNKFRYADPMLILGIVATFLILDVLITTLAFKLIESRRVAMTLKGET